MKDIYIAILILNISHKSTSLAIACLLYLSEPYCTGFCLLCVPLNDLIIIKYNST